MTLKLLNHEQTTELLEGFGQFAHCHDIAGDLDGLYQYSPRRGAETYGMHVKDAVPEVLYLAHRKHDGPKLFIPDGSAHYLSAKRGYLCCLCGRIDHNDAADLVNYKVFLDWGGLAKAFSPRWRSVAPFAIPPICPDCTQALVDAKPDHKPYTIEGLIDATMNMLRSRKFIARVKQYADTWASLRFDPRRPQ